MSEIKERAVEKMKRKKLISITRKCSNISITEKCEMYVQAVEFLHAP